MTEPLLNGKSKIDFSINGDFIDILPTFDERLLPRIIQFNPRLPTINEGSFLAYSNSVESSNSPKRAKTQLILEFFLDDFFNRLVKSENFDSIEYIQAPYQTNGCNIEFCDTGSYIKGSCNGSDQPINLTRLITIEKDGHKQVIIANPTVSKKLKRD
ncbi:hypothetical protein HOK68_02835 [Candidatus Woesearchaeota archaeon]|nr:hypothetical protein [Candidatus Woesearchaeota archaeon]